MSRWLLERRISEVSERLKRLRAELSVVDEQLAFFADAADEARLRALVSETPLADREHHDAQKHADAMAQSRADVVLAIQALERSQDELLDRLVNEHKPDIAILDIKMPGLDGLEAAREIAGERRAAVLILTAFSQKDLIQQARDAGALAYLVKPFQKSELLPAIEVALGRFAEAQALEREVQSLEEQLQTRKVVDRAKGMLMDRHHLNENDAFSFIQKTAMRQRQTMKAVAEQIIAGDLVPPAS